MPFVLAHVGTGTIDPLQIGPSIVFGVMYGLRVRALAGTPRAVPGWRQGCFAAGLVLIVASLASPLGHLADELFLAHMAEHLLLADVAALLLVLGVTGPLLAPLLRAGLLGPLRALAHPVLALVLWAANLLAWHIPVLHEAAVEGDLAHAVQHGLFVGLGANVWMALFGPLPKPAWFGNAAKLAFIVAVRLVGAVLANVLLFGGGVFYDVYAPGEAYWNISPEGDQTTAGAIMMVEESILTLLLFGWLFMKAGREGEERQALLDLAARRGVALSPERATRAVAAGRGEELTRRIDPGAEG